MNFFIFNQRSTRLAFGLSVLFILLSLGWFWGHFSQLPPQVPFLYSRPWGVEQLVSPLVLLALPLLSLFVLFINALLANLLLAYPFLVNLLLWGAALFAFLGLFNLMKIINIVT